VLGAGVTRSWWCGFTCPAPSMRSWTRHPPCTRSGSTGTSARWCCPRSRRWCRLLKEQ